MNTGIPVNTAAANPATPSVAPAAPSSQVVHRTDADSPYRNAVDGVKALRAPGGDDRLQVSEHSRTVSRWTSLDGETAEALPGSPPSPKAETRLDRPETQNIHADAQKIREEKQKIQEELAKLQSRGEPTGYQKNRLARLDRIEVQIRQGEYQVDPFMLDRIAVRLAKLLV